MELMPIVYPFEVFIAALLLSLPIIAMAPKWLADTTFIAGCACLLLVAAPTALLFGTTADQFLVAIQFLFWLIPGAIILARTIFAAPDADPDYETCDPRWLYNTVEFVARAYDQPEPPRRAQHDRGPVQPPTQGPEPGTNQPEQQQQQRLQRNRRQSLTEEEALQLLEEINRDSDQDRPR